MKFEIGENISICKYQNSVFETILIEEGHPYFLDKHLNRLKKASKEMLSLNININEIKKFIYDNIPIKKTIGARIVCNSDSCILSFRDVEYRGSGFLNISTIIRNINDKKYYYKNNEYSDRLEELIKSRSLGFLDSIYLNDKGFVTSCSIANIFFIKAGVIYTPAIENGLLNGIVREIILKNNNCIEGNFTIEDFIKSDGIFISNSLLEILKVEGIKDKKVVLDEHTYKKIKESYFHEKEIDRRKYFG